MASPTNETRLNDLRLDIMACNRCQFGSVRAKSCAGDGSVTAPIFVVGEAPGRKEDKVGRAMVGDHSDRFDEWLRLAGLSREHLFITHLLKCVPLKMADGDEGPYLRMSFPDDDPTPVEKCRRYLEAQLKLVQPRVVVLLGQRALHHVLLRGAVGQAKPFPPWVGRMCRRRDRFGETRFISIWPPSRICRQPNPRDEHECVEALRAARDYLVAIQAGLAPPLVDLHEVKSSPPPQYQDRLRLFGQGKPGRPLENKQP